MNKNLLDRKYWNVVKGFGAILVLLGHIMPWDVILIIYGCHVPLFFFVSGYLYNEEKYGDNPYFNLASRIKSSWIKYGLVYTGAILLHNLFVRYSMMDDFLYLNITYTKNELYVKIVEAFLGNGDELMVSALWFVPCLVCANILLGFIVYISRRIFVITNSNICKFVFQLMAIGVATMFGYYLASNKIVLPDKFHISLEVMIFLWIGYLARNYGEEIKAYLKWYIAVILVIPYYMLSHDTLTNLVYDEVYPMMYVTAFLGIYIILTVCIYMTKVKVLSSVFSLLGEASFVMMAIQVGTIKIIDRLYAIHLGPKGMEKYTDLVGAFPELRWLYIVVVVFISIVITGTVKFIKKKLKH